MVGSAIHRALLRQGFQNIIGPSSADLDLTRQTDVEFFFNKEKPDYVFLAAAKVGGIYANNTYPAEFIFKNLQIQNNVIHSAYLSCVKKLLFLGSSCIYPKLCPQPIKEEYLLTGPLEPTNEPYAIAKIAGLKLCEYYNKEYKTNFISTMPTNLYGPGDNYDPLNSHVVPGLIRRFHDAKISNAASVTIWGTGNPLREFLFVDDLADACLFLMKEYDTPKPINIGSGEEVSIKDLAIQIAKVTGFTGSLQMDYSKPDGTPRKLLDATKLMGLNWKAKFKLTEGLQVTYENFLQSHA